MPVYRFNRRRKKALEVSYQRGFFDGSNENEYNERPGGAPSLYGVGFRHGSSMRRVLFRYLMGRGGGRR